MIPTGIPPSSWLSLLLKNAEYEQNPETRRKGKPHRYIQYMGTI